jgi:TM2 domain-containing membrane protein YozV
VSNSPKYCNNFGEKLDLKENKRNCPKCGTEIQMNDSNQEPIISYVPYKSPGTAALLAFIGGIFGILGIGHFYAGKIGRGIIILIFGLILAGAIMGSSLSILAMQSNSIENESSGEGSAIAIGLFSGVVYFILFIWQIFSARGLAKKYNSLARTLGTEPW